MPPPTNISFLTATDIGTLPATVTQRVDDAGTTYTVYYSYTAQTTDRPMVGAWGFGDLTTYEPTMIVYVGPAGSPTQYLSLSAGNVPLQMPVTAGTTYFFKIVPNGGNPTPANLTLNVQHFPNAPMATTGQIAVTDDTVGFPIAVLDPTTAEPLRYVLPATAGEHGAVLTNGVTALSSSDEAVSNNLVIYSAAISQLTTTSVGTGQINGLTTDMSTRFYVANVASTTITSVSKSGAILSTFGPVAVGSPRAIGAAQDNSILYYADSTVNAPIHRWDLVNNVALTNLVAGIATYAIQAKLLVLSDGTILAAYQGGGSGQDVTVKHYSAAGAVLHTYSLGDASTEVRMAMAIDDPLSFWIWTKDVSGGVATGFSRFRNVVISSGAATTVGPHVQYESGVYQGAPTATPVRFGYSESCDFWIIRAGNTPTPPTVRTSTQITRRQRTAPHLSNEQLWMYYSQFQLDLQVGQGAITGQGQAPQIMLEWSDDGGHTWSNEHWVMASQLGQYKARAIWRRLGRSRDRIFRVTVSDPVAWNLIAAYLNIEPGTS